MYVNLGTGVWWQVLNENAFFQVRKSPRFCVVFVCDIEVSASNETAFFSKSLKPTTVHFHRLRAMHSKRAGLLLVAVSIPLQLSQKLEDKINKASQ
jgi:hypothetical protein